jgi:hypothetical protein
MSRVVSFRTAAQCGRWFPSFLAVVALVVSAHAAAAQSSSDGAIYAQEWTPKNERASLHIDGGMYAPIEANAPSPSVGLRLSRLVGGHLQAGVLTGWTFERKDRTQSGDSLPGLQPKIVLARVDSYLIPLMGYLRVNFTEKHWLVPYVGVGTGFEWLTIQATDYVSQTTASASYSNWGWEGWVGLGIRLGQDLRVDGEVYYNGASPERDVVDQNGQPFKEVVNCDGVGGRVGVDIIWHQ